MSRIDSRVSISRFASQSSSASSAQLSIDAGLHSFSREASNPVNLIPMASASFAFQFGRSALTAMGAGRILSNVLAFGMEVSALRGTSCALSPSSGDSFLNGESFLRSALDLSVFKLSGHFLRSSNFFGRHGIQAFAMMGAEDLGSLAGIVDHSTATGAQRFAHAFSSSIQLEVGAFLTGVVTGQSLRSVERSLDVSRTLRLLNTPSQDFTSASVNSSMISVSSRPQASRMIIGVTGKDASGKDSVLEMLAAQGFRTMSLSDALRAQLVADGKEPSRENCRVLANELRARDGASALARLAISQMEPGVNYAFGSIRNPAEVEALREAGLGNFHFIATTAPAELRFNRLNSRGRLGDAATLEAFLAHEALEAGSTDPNAQQMDAVISMADHQIDNSGTLDQFRTNVSSFLDRLR